MNQGEKADRPRARLNGIRGFTLMEIMIVVALLGLIAGIAVPSYRQIRTASRENQARSELELIASAIRELAWDTGQWPGGTARNGSLGDEIWDLATDDAGLRGNDGDFTEWKGPYIRSVPKDPWGFKYFFDSDYRVDGVWRVAVGSYGPNGSGPNRYDSDNIIILLDE